MLTLRPMQGRLSPEVADAIAALAARSHQDAWSPQSYHSTGDHILCVVAENGPTLVGFALLSLVAGECEVLELVVDEAVRRQGIGARLLDTAQKIAADRGASTFYLEVRASNEGARALYKKAGFAEIGRRSGYYRSPCEDAVLMKREGKDG